jgi:predicted dehydrogenase
LGFIGSGFADKNLHWLTLVRMADEFEIIDVSSRNAEKTNSIRHIMRNDRSESYVREFSDFYNCIRNGEKPKSSFHEGYRDLQLGITALTTNERWDTLSLALP